MSLASYHPKRWNEVIGQARVMRVLHALLRAPQYRPRGLIFEGPYAVGKTSCAYLFARALMCLGEDPMGCGSCPSCLVATQTMFDEVGMCHPSFREIDAASHSGVDKARALMETIEGGATLGRRHVVVVDEAHRLSAEAWDVFLKPLDQGDDSVVFLFVTSEAESIPGPIKSRCACVRFDQVDTRDLVGKLMAIANERDIPHTLEGLSAVAETAKGRPRDAIKNLGIVATSGVVNLDTVDVFLNQDSTTACRRILECLTEDDLAGAVSNADLLTQRLGAAEVIGLLFSYFAKDIFTGATIAQHFAPLSAMTAFFLKWSRVSHITSDVIPLFTLELNDMRHERFSVVPVKSTEASRYHHVPTANQGKRQVTPAPVSATRFRELLEK